MGIIWEEVDGEPILIALSNSKEIGEVTLLKDPHGGESKWHWAISEFRCLYRGSETTSEAAKAALEKQWAACLADLGIAQSVDELRQAATSARLGVDKLCFALRDGRQTPYPRREFVLETLKRLGDILNAVAPRSPLRKE